MFSGWLPSFFQKKSTNAVEGSSQQPQDDASKSKSKSKSTSSKVTVIPDEELLLDMFTVACFNQIMLPTKQGLSGVFAPLPLLALFCLCWMAATDEVRKHMRSVCGIDKKGVMAISSLLASIQPSLNKRSLLVFRILTTPDQMNAIDPHFAEKVVRRFGQGVIYPLDRAQQSEHVRVTTRQLLPDLRIPSSSGLLGLAAAAIHARWKGESTAHPDRPFATSVRTRQMHSFFELRCQMRILREKEMDCLLISLHDSPFDLVMLRPTALSGLSNLRRELSGQKLHTTLRRLAAAKPVNARVLLPCIDLATADTSLLPKWRLSGVLTERVRLRRKGLQQENVCPQFREIAHTASIRIDQAGIRMASLDRRPRSSSCSSRSSLLSYYSAPTDPSLDANFNHRLDSPFIFLVAHTQTMAPLLAGTYAGSQIAARLRTVSPVKQPPKKSLVRKSIDILSRPLKSSSSKSQEGKAKKPKTGEDKKSSGKTKTAKVSEGGARGNYPHSPSTPSPSRSAALPPSARSTLKNSLVSAVKVSAAGVRDATKISGRKLKDKLSHGSRRVRQKIGSLINNARSLSPHSNSSRREQAKEMGKQTSVSIAPRNSAQVESGSATSEKADANERKKKEMNASDESENSSRKSTKSEDGGKNMGREEKEESEKVRKLRDSTEKLVKKTNKQAKKGYSKLKKICGSISSTRKKDQSDRENKNNSVSTTPESASKSAASKSSEKPSYSKTNSAEQRSVYIDSHLANEKYVSKSFDAPKKPVNFKEQQPGEKDEKDKSDPIRKLRHSTEKIVDKADKSARKGLSKVKKFCGSVKRSFEKKK